MFKHQNIFLTKIPVILSGITAIPSAMPDVDLKINKVTDGLSD